jgi:hypothetical protein
MVVEVVFLRVFSSMVRHVFRGDVPLIEDQDKPGDIRVRRPTFTARSAGFS